MRWYWWKLVGHVDTVVVGQREVYALALPNIRHPLSRTLLLLEFNHSVNIDVIPLSCGALSSPLTHLLLALAHHFPLLVGAFGFWNVTGFLRRLLASSRSVTVELRLESGRTRFWELLHEGLKRLVFVMAMLTEWSCPGTARFWAR